tara:strand:+ start:151 stop:480 length:330 start_codon:yes stop_codon:yes gene_type:complete
MKSIRLMLSIATLTLTVACGTEFDTASAEQNYSYEELQSQHQRPAKGLNADAHVEDFNDPVEGRVGKCTKGGHTLDYCNGPCGSNNCGVGCNDMAMRCGDAGGKWTETA